MFGFAEYNLRRTRRSKELWRQFVVEVPFLLHPRGYRYLLADVDRMILHFPEMSKLIEIEFPAFIELNRKTGAVIRRAGSDDEEFVELVRSHVWQAAVMKDRPPVPLPWGPQRAGKFPTQN